MPAVFKTRGPAPAQSRAGESRGGGATGNPRAARDELGAKKMGVAPAELSNPDPRLIMLRKRQREEMEALRGILRKAELLAGGKTISDGRAAPRRGKDGRFLAAETRPAPAAAEADRATSAKRRKTMMPLVKILKPKMSADEISNLTSRVSSLSEDMPARILEFLKKECSGHEDAKRGEIEIDIGSMRHPALFELRKMLDEFAEEENRRRQKENSSKNASRPTSCSSSGQHEDGEIVEEDLGVTVDTCSLASSVADKILCSKQEILEDGEIAEGEEGDAMCSDAAPVATENFAESGNIPSSSSSSSSSSGSSSNSGCSSGGSCSDSSDSDSSDSDSDDESVTSSPAPAVLPKTGTSPMAVDLCSSPCLTEQVPRSISPRRRSSSLPEDGEIEEECPPAPDKLAEAVTSPRISYSSGSADDGSVSTVPAPVVLPEPTVQQPLSQVEYRALIAKALQKQRRRQNPERQRAYEELEEKERKAKPISDWIQPMQLSQLGITPVEYTVTSERRVPGRGSPVQRLLGLFLKAE